jgi:hypothetical protein
MHTGCEQQIKVCIRVLYIVFSCYVNVIIRHSCILCHSTQWKVWKVRGASVEYCAVVWPQIL